jgi:hypothetical protein
MDRVRSIAVYTFAAFGALFFLLVIIGVIADYRSFDRTSGGYDPPYTDYSGVPIDWNEAYVTEDGFFQSGRVVNTHVNCTTGMISYEIYGMKFDFRELSPRALAVHQPAQACEDRGFQPQF